MGVRRVKPATKEHKPVKRVRKVKAPPAKRHLLLPKLGLKAIAAIDNWFMNGGNFLQAALAAGFSDSSVFRREEVQLELEKRQGKLRKKYEASEERIIHELSLVAFGGIGDLLRVNDDGSAYLDFNDLTREQRAIITEFSSDTVNMGRSKKGKKRTLVVKQRVKFANKMDALNQLARIFGMNDDRTTHKLEADDEIIEALFAGRKRAAAESAKVVEGSHTVIDG